MRLNRSVVARVMLGAALLMLAALAGGVAAQEADPLQVTLEQFVVVPPQDEGEAEQLIPLPEDEMSPSGTVIEYAVAVKNSGDEAIDDMVLGLLVPVGTVYVEDGETLDESEAVLQFSIDGGQTYRTPPVAYMVTDEDGESVRRIATPDMYTHLRLIFLRAIRPGEELVFRYRVQVT